MRIFKLNPTSRPIAMTALQTAPDGYMVRIGEPTRSLEQNALIHALMTEVGDKLEWKWNGQDVDMDDLKSIFVAAYRKASGKQSRFVLGIDGQPVPLSWRTREFTKKECGEFVDMVQAWMAEQ